MFWPKVQQAIASNFDYRKIFFFHILFKRLKFPTNIILCIENVCNIFLSLFFISILKGIRLIILLTLAYIINEEENHLLLADDSFFNFLVDSLNLAWASTGSEHREANGYSVTELLEGISRFALNEENKKLIMKKGNTFYSICLISKGVLLAKFAHYHFKWFYAILWFFLRTIYRL